MNGVARRFDGDHCSGIIAFGNGTAFGIWPLDGGDRGRRHPHVLYRTRWSTDAFCTTQPNVDTRYTRKVSSPLKLVLATIGSPYSKCPQKTSKTHLVKVGRRYSFLKSGELFEVPFDWSTPFFDNR